MPVFAITFSDVITFLNFMDLLLYAPQAYLEADTDSGAQFCFEELPSGQVKIDFLYPENVEVYYTTDNRKATQTSPKYQSPIIVDIGTSLHWLAYYTDTGKTIDYNLLIERNENPELVIENNAQFGTMITFEDNKWVSDLPVYYAIIPEKEFHFSSQYDTKILFNWQEYFSPIIMSDISYDDFVIAYVIPATEDKLSSDVQYKVFHKVNGSCFNYVFYDKGEYSDGWRYIEICPIGQEGIYGYKGFSTSAVNSSLGQGLENTEKIVLSFSNNNSLISSNYAAQNALNLIYVNKGDWYLPSIDELKEASKIYPELFSLFSDYWSSTEKDADKAYTLRWSRNKDSELKYYVVRRF